jgi:hypothetical protein
MVSLWCQSYTASGQSRLHQVVDIREYCSDTRYRSADDIVGIGDEAYTYRSPDGNSASIRVLSGTETVDIFAADVPAGVSDTALTDLAKLAVARLTPRTP